jgi:hypothetical protein
VLHTDVQAPAPSRTTQGIVQNEVRGHNTEPTNSQELVTPQKLTIYALTPSASSSLLQIHPPFEIQ